MFYYHNIEIMEPHKRKNNPESLSEHSASHHGNNVGAVSRQNRIHENHSISHSDAGPGVDTNMVTRLAPPKNPLDDFFASSDEEAPKRRTVPRNNEYDIFASLDEDDVPAQHFRRNISKNDFHSVGTSKRKDSAPSYNDGGRQRQKTGSNKRTAQAPTAAASKRGSSRYKSSYGSSWDDDCSPKNLSRAQMLATKCSNDKQKLSQRLRSLAEKAKAKVVPRVSLSASCNDTSNSFSGSTNRCESKFCVYITGL